jgi:hypothetical protein
MPLQVVPVQRRSWQASCYISPDKGVSHAQQNRSVAVSLPRSSGIQQRFRFQGQSTTATAGRSAKRHNQPHGARRARQLREPAGFRSPSTGPYGFRTGPSRRDGPMPRPHLQLQHEPRRYVFASWWSVALAIAPQMAMSASNDDATARGNAVASWPAEIPLNSRKSRSTGHSAAAGAAPQSHTTDRAFPAKSGSMGRR